MFFSPAVGVEIHNRDSTWTPEQWHEMAEVSSNDDSSDEKEAHVHVSKAYNEAMTRIASRTEQKVKHVSVRLSKEWEEATANKKNPMFRSRGRGMSRCLQCNRSTRQRRVIASL